MGTVLPNVEENVEKGAHVYTDELKSYFGLQADYAHDVINHSETYVNGQIHTERPRELLELAKARSGRYLRER